MRVTGATAADWLEAIGTSGALLIGAFVLAREQRDRRRSQARQVNAWATQVLPKRDETESGAYVAMEGQCVAVEALNTSDEPVYDFLVWVHHSYDARAPISGSLERKILPPGSHVVLVDGIELPQGGLVGMPHVDVTFRDAADRRWQRLHNGELSRDRLSPDGRSTLLRYSLRSAWRRTRLRIKR